MSVEGEGLVSAGVKAEILLAACSAGVVIADVARLYGVTPRQIYCWRHTQVRSQKRRQARCVGKFVELVPESKASLSGVAKVHDVSLRFAYCTLSIEGAISAVCLSELIGLMGSEC